MLSKTEMELVRSLAEFRRALRAFLAASEAMSKSAGITAVQYQALLAICAWQGPMAVRDLADQLMLTHSAAVQMIDRLVKAGWVRREGSGDDRRRVLVALAPEGGELLASLVDRHVDELLQRERDLQRALRGIKAVARAGRSGERAGPPRG